MSEQRNPASGESLPAEVNCALDGTSNQQVRQLVRELLGDQAGIGPDDALIVVEELVTNARRHGLPPRWCRLTFTQQDRRLRVEVDDASAAPPRVRQPDHTGGRGLLLVDRMASAWGYQQYERHKTVWAEVTLDHAKSEDHARHLTLLEPGQSPSTRRHDSGKGVSDERPARQAGSGRDHEPTF